MYEPVLSSTISHYWILNNIRGCFVNRGIVSHFLHLLLREFNYALYIDYALSHLRDHWSGMSRSSVSSHHFRITHFIPDLWLRCPRTIFTQEILSAERWRKQRINDRGEEPTARWTTSSPTRRAYSTRAIESTRCCLSIRCAARDW